MKDFKALFVPGLIVVMHLALFAQEPQGRGAQGTPAPDGAAGARAGQVAPVPDGAAGARGGPQGGRGGGPPAGAGARGGGGGPKNVQVLVGADLPSTMQSFVAALGLLDKGTCAYCHVEDRSSDEKKPKQVARRMITMMRAINGTFPDGKQHVNCYTCHRGSTVPLMEPELPGLGQ